MKFIYIIICLLISLSINVGASASQSEKDAEALLKALVIEVESAEGGCKALVDKVEKAIYDNEVLIDRLVSSKEGNSGTLDEDLEQRSIAAIGRIKECAGAAEYSEKFVNVIDPFAERFKRPKPLRITKPIAERFKKPKSIALKSESSCKSDCCVKGWETWAAVAFYSTACLGGSNQACCMAVTVASYSECVDLYCPSNNCCADVPVSVPPP